MFSFIPQSKESLAARPAAGRCLSLGAAEGRQSAQVLAAQSRPQVAASEVAPAPALVWRIEPVVDVRIVQWPAQ